jgi:hypothetical protein
MALYVTKQAGRVWYILFYKLIKTLGFTANKADHCFYAKNINHLDFVLLFLYVDNIIVATTTESHVGQFRYLIGLRFHLSHSGDLMSNLNINITRSR